jgi:hypothetical protein
MLLRADASNTRGQSQFNKERGDIMSMHAQFELMREVRDADPHYRINGLLIGVEVIDMRRVWDRVDLLIRPRTGKGEVWVSREAIVELSSAVDEGAQAQVEYEKNL